MLCVTKIEAREVPDDWWKIDRMVDYIPVGVIPDDGDGPIPESFEVVSELVKGRKFRVPIRDDLDRGHREICIGWSKQVCEAIGIPLEVFEIQERYIEESQAEITRLSEVKKKLSFKVAEYRNMSFWNRLKYLFTG